MGTPSGSRRCDTLRITDGGAGPVVIVIPGVQGRWEWMSPALHELRRTCRVISYSLCGEPGSGGDLDPAIGFDSYLRQLDDVFQLAAVTRAAVCGVSLGGCIAVRYAASRPERVSALVLVSAPAPGWTPSERQQRDLARPHLRAPLFVASAPARLWPEVRSAIPSWRARVAFAVTHTARAVTAPLIPARAAARIAAQQAADFAADPAKVRAPTLVITGEDALDRVVPPPVSRRYLTTIRGAQYVKLAHTGHLGMVTQPVHFSNAVSTFVHANHP